MGDEILQEVIELLYGGGADELIAKMNPDQADLSTHDKRKKRERTEARIGLATNVIGIGAGAAATPPAIRAVRVKNRERKGLAPKGPGRFERKLGETKAWKGAKKVTSKPKVALGIAGAAAGLQVANLGGDFVANRVLSRSAKKDPNVKGGAGTALRVVGEETRKPFQKSEPDVRNTASEAKGVLTRAPMPKHKMIGITTKGGFRRLPEKVKTSNEVVKSAEVDVIWEGEIAKADADKQQIFGWASVVEVDGEPVVDLQGDYISADEMEKAGYEYVMKSRKGGDMHLRDEWSPVQASEMIESFIVTPEKRGAMGLPDSVPSGWWVGFQVQDPDVWAKVKSGERTGFSIHGHGRRT